MILPQDDEAVFLSSCNLLENCCHLRLAASLSGICHPRRDICSLRVYKIPLVILMRRIMHTYVSTRVGTSFALLAEVPLLPACRVLFFFSEFCCTKFIISDWLSLSRASWASFDLQIDHTMGKLVISEALEKDQKRRKMIYTCLALT